MGRLVLEGLSRTIQGAAIVTDLDLVVEDGEYCVLVGPSGCGKSTTLRLVAGLDTPSSGRVAIGERVVDTLEPHERDVAFVFQGYALYPHLCVAKNLAFGLERRRVYGNPLRALVDGTYRAKRRAESQAIAARVDEVAVQLELGALLERRPGELSGGQQQRVALGRALVRSPQVFLLDEPLSNLDARLRREVRGELRALQTRLGATFVHVTHDQEEALALADRLVVMAQGRIQQVGSAHDVHRSPANRFVASFVGAPPMNFVEGRIAQGHFEGGGLRANSLARFEGAAVLGLRPCDVELTAPGAQALGRARVVDVRDLGDHADVALETEVGARVVARRSAADQRAHSPSVGDEVGIDAPRARLHLFEPGEFGARIATNAH